MERKVSPDQSLRHLIEHNDERRYPELRRPSAKGDHQELTASANASSQRSQMPGRSNPPETLGT